MFRNRKASGVKARGLRNDVELFSELKWKETDSQYFSGKEREREPIQLARSGSFNICFVRNYISFFFFSIKVRSETKASMASAIFRCRVHFYSVITESGSADRMWKTLSNKNKRPIVSFIPRVRHVQLTVRRYREKKIPFVTSMTGKKKKKNCFNHSELYIKCHPCCFIQPDWERV